MLNNRFTIFKSGTPKDLQAPGAYVVQNLFAIGRWVDTTQQKSSAGLL